LLSNQLTASDMISIVVYAGSSDTVLDPTQGDQKKIIHNALGSLNAGGSTHGEAGIELAYEIAADNLINDGTNRVILATDGDFNVGISNIKKLKKLVASKRKTGIALTPLGFGSGNYNDHLLEQLAQEGNGNYAYIDTVSETRKMLVNELDSSLLTIAEDVKIQVEFSPDTVSEYRLIGYTNRHLANVDFNNDKVDAGEIGAGHTVTALYEIAFADQAYGKSIRTCIIKGYG
jgi:Ca-activated chloride channel family protein